ncbi:hypothetical protein, partial [Vibrio cholerae]|uniref:hypothetical protein n=1 Tax=Vibrio cholerae TaxID=666 RepID=UPI001C108C68
MFSENSVEFFFLYIRVILFLLVRFILKEQYKKQIYIETNKKHQIGNPHRKKPPETPNPTQQEYHHPRRAT